MDPMEKAVAKALQEMEVVPFEVLPELLVTPEPPIVDKPHADEPHVETDPEPIVEPIVEPVVEQVVVAPVLESIAEPVIKPVTEPVVKRKPVRARRAPRTFRRVTIAEQRLADMNVAGRIGHGLPTQLFDLLASQVLENIEAIGGESSRSLAVFGPKGVGKTCVAVNLAFAMAKTTPVSIIDLALGRPRLQDFLGVHVRRGVSEYLEGGCELGNVGLVSQFPNITFFPTKPAGDRSAELLALPRARQIVAEIAALTRSKTTIVDLPGNLDNTESHPILRGCDAALLVVEYAKTSKAEIKEAIRLLGKTPLVGTVSNNGPGP